MDTEKYHTGRKRLWAAIVDTIVFMPFLLVTQWIFNYTANNIILLSWILFAKLAPLIYSVVLNYQYGQTIGKWVAGIKIMDYDETRQISLKQSLLRDSFFIILEVVALGYFSFLAIQEGDLNYLYTGYADFASLPIFIWTLLELITMLTNKKKRAVHDFLARSVVVRIKQ